MATNPAEDHLPDLIFENVQDDETIHQRCVIVKARYSPVANSPSMVTIEQKTTYEDDLYPPQTWPVAEGQIKIIAILSPGINVLHIHPNSDATHVTKLRLGYTPLLRQPPLHLAIMVADDSDLTIDYQPSRSHPHFNFKGSVDTAINRFRMTVYMWQAMIAEDMRMKGLGRRSFRLDEDWGIDTTSATFLNAVHHADIWDAGAARLTAKVHVIRSEHTMKEIRNPKIAHDNPLGKNKKRLHDWFAQALQVSGIGVFTNSARPIVAGLIIDSHWEQEDLFVHGHTAMGSHNALGLSLCVMGSHLVHSWPEHVEYINTHLTDASRPDFGAVSNANAPTGTMWEVCSIGQTDFLHQLGHAFGASHTTGIMRGGCAQHWPRHFVARTAPDRLTAGGEQGIVVDGNTTNEAVFDIKDLLAFSHLPHFWLPGDRKTPIDPLYARYVMPTVDVEDVKTETGDLVKQIVMSSPANIVRVLWDDEASERPSLNHQLGGAKVPLSQVEQTFSRDEHVRLAILGGNGKECIVPNLWDLVTDQSTIRIPDSKIVLRKRSVMCKHLEERIGDMPQKTLWRWATLLSRQMEHGTIARANEINIRVGCNLLGLYVRFEDGIRVNCGPRFHKMMGGRYEKHFGGHVKEDLMIPPSQRIVRVEVGRDSKVIRGVKIHLANGEVKGALSGGGYFEELCVLETFADERVVGLFGRSYFGEQLDGVVEFGLITAPRNAELPVQVYGMPDVQNTDGGLTEADYDREDDPEALPHEESDSSDSFNDSDPDNDLNTAMADMEVS